ncbi:MAG: FAD-dependent oxidoreductase [Patescibacteria group bacterium]
MQNKNKILILGGGFAGITVAHKLANASPQGKDLEITLINKRSSFIFHADLYEVATAFTEKKDDECITALRETVAIPYAKIFKGKKVNFIQDNVTKISPEQKVIETERGGKISYDTLVVALGSVSNDYGIEGLRQFSYPLKTIEDALAINCHLETYFKNLWKKEIKKEVEIVIGGGGFTGVELASELPGFLKKICKKYDYPYSRVSLTILDGGKSLGGQDEKVSVLIKARLKSLGIKVEQEARIQKRDIQKIYVLQREIVKEFEADICLWTGGVKANPLIAQSFKTVAKNGALEVNEYLQSKDFPDVYAAGDNASFPGAPMLATTAIIEGKIIALNILGKKTPFTPKLESVSVPLGGKFALCKDGEKVEQGFWCWVTRRFRILKFFCSILSPWEAFKVWMRENKVFVANDEKML